MFEFNLKMASTVSGGVVLDSGAIIGMAVGGSILVFATVSLSIVLALRSRERRGMLARYRRGSFALGRTSSTNSRRYRTIPDPQAAYNLSPSRVPRLGERERYPLASSSPSRQAPWINNTFSAMQSVRSAGNERLPGMPWPLPRTTPLSTPSSAGKLRLKPLPAIRESSASKSSSVVLCTPPQPASKSKIADPSSTRAIYSTTPDLVIEGIRKKPLMQGLEVASSDAPGRFNFSPVQTKPNRIVFLQRSKSDSYSSLKTPLRNYLHGSSQCRLKSPSRSTSLHGQDPGISPQEPVPSLPIATRDRCNAIVWRPSNQYLATPTSCASFNSSILNLDPPAASSNLASGGLCFSANVSPISSPRSSEGPSIFGDGGTKWDLPPMTGLTSPSGRYRLRKPQGSGGPRSTTYKDSKGLSSNASAVDRSISGKGGVSLDTLGPRVPPKSPARAISDMEKQESSGTACFDALSPSPTPAARVKRQNLDLRVQGSMVADDITSQVIRLSSAQTRPDWKMQGTPDYRVSPYQSSDQPRTSTPKRESPRSPLGSTPKRASPTFQRASAMKDVNSHMIRHRRQKCVRISLVPSILGPSRCTPISEESREVASNSSTRSVNTNRSSAYLRPLPRPPSIAVFDPQVSPTPRRPADRDAYMKGELVSPAELSANLQRVMSRGRLDQGFRLFENANDIGSPGPSITSSPRSCLPRRTTSQSSILLNATCTSPLRTPDSIKEPNSPCSAFFGFDSRTWTPSPERKGFSSEIRGPRTPPRVIRSPRAKPQFRSVLEQCHLGLGVDEGDESQRRFGMVNFGPPVQPKESFVRSSEMSIDYSRSSSPSKGGPASSVVVVAGVPKTLPSNRTCAAEKYPLPAPLPTTATTVATATTTPPRVRNTSLAYQDRLHQQQQHGQQKSQDQDQNQHQMEIAHRDSKNFEMPRPRTGGGQSNTIGLGLSFQSDRQQEEHYDQNGFLRS